MRWRRPGRPASLNEASLSLKERIERDDLFLDSYVDSYGFAPFLRDYDVVIECPAPKPNWSGGAQIADRYRYRFTHVPEVRATAVYPAERWQDEETWDDRFTDYEAWERAREPSEYIWPDFEVAYPGLSYVAGSPVAAEWSERVGRPMHEVRVESNVLVHRIVCHDLVVRRLVLADPFTGELTPVDEP
jgi:hypothetical protein